MNKLRLFLLCTSMVVALAVFPSLSKACGPWGGCNANWLGTTTAFGCSGTLYGLGYVPVPPYFALHPPVYYGQRYFRSYGDSPFARAPRRPAASRQVARVIINPHVKSVPMLKKEQKSDKPKTAQFQPRMIVNPFYRSSDKQLASRQ